MSEERLKIAVFIDFDNIEIGVKSTLNTFFDIGVVLEAIKERGEIVTKVAYGDWTRAGDYGRSLSQHAVHMVQRNLTPGGDKNGADINLALDALEMAFTHNHINSFVIVSGDSDFISLVEKLKQYDRKVFVVGGRAFTSVVMQKNCTEFVAYENLVSRGRSVDRSRPSAESSLPQAMPLVRRALKLLADREVLPQLGLLKSTLLQLDSAFSEREYGAGSFRDFVQKLAKAGHVTLKGNERSFHVELREGVESGSPASSTAAPAAVASPPIPHAVIEAPAPDVAGAHVADETAVDSKAKTPHTAAEASQVVEQALARATATRWPLYVRQIKQLIRAVEPQFDERRYGFGSLIEALKFCQREGVLRLERDRQGIVRVWPAGRVEKGGPVTEESLVGMDGEHHLDASETPAGPQGYQLPPGPGDGDEIFDPATEVTTENLSSDVAASQTEFHEPVTVDAGDIEDVDGNKLPAKAAEAQRAAPPAGASRRRTSGTRTATTRVRKAVSTPRRPPATPRTSRAKKGSS